MTNLLKSVLRFISQSLKFIFRSLKSAIFLVAVLLFVLSHTLVPFAALTARALASLGLQPVFDLTTSSVMNRRPAKKQQELRIADLEAENRRLQNLSYVEVNGEKVSVKKASSTIAARVQKRTAAVATANVSSVFGEAIPLWGIAIIAGATAYELHSACETMKDMQSLQESLAQVDDFETIGETDRICGLEKPTTDEIWTTVKASPSQAWHSAVLAADGAGEWYGSLDAPDFGGWYTASLDWLSKVSPW